MTTLQKLSLRLSQIRQRLNELAGLESDAVTEELRAEIDTLTAEFQTVETQHRAAIVADSESRQSDGGEGTGEEREYRDLVNRAEVRDYLTEAVTGREAEGAASELRAHIFGDRARAGLVPWDVLLPRTGERPEARADAATTGPADVGTVQLPIVQRVFAQSASAFLGVDMPTVPMGEAVFTVLSAGASAENRAGGVAKDAEAATFTPTSLAPIRLSARYLVRVEDLARLAGMEESLRADLRGALSDGMDKQSITGDGNAPNVQGFLDVLADPAVPNVAPSFSSMIKTAAASVDGRFAVNLPEVRMLVGADTYAIAAGQFNQVGDVASADYLVSRSGGFQVSANIAKADIQHGITFALRGIGSAVAPVWDGLEIIRDPYSNAETGQVALTAIMLWNFKVIRTAAYRQVSFKTN